MDILVMDSAIIIILLATAAIVGMLGFWLGGMTARRQRDSEKEKRVYAEAQAAAGQQAIEDWDKQKQEFMQNIRESIKADSRESALELLKNHKAESQTSHELHKKSLTDIIKDMEGRFEKLVKEVDNFGGRLQKQESAVDTLDRILTEPRKMGAAAEVILENNLKSMGLSEPQDFLLQSSFDTGGGKLRPDAVIFLPDDNVIIIDSKSSSILKDLILAENDDSANEAALNKKLKVAMRKHLQDLSGKEYIAAVKKGVKSPHRPSFQPQQIFTLLWVPTDAMLEHIRRADDEFVFLASGKGIHVVGPAALQAVIAVAAAKISAHKQNENQAVIVQETETLLQSITTALNHAARIGNAIRSADSAYDKLLASVNGRLLPRAERLVKLGVGKPQGDFAKPLPQRNPDMLTIEAEEEEAEKEEPPTIPPDRPDE